MKFILIPVAVVVTVAAVVIAYSVLDTVERMDDGMWHE